MQKKLEHLRSSFSHSLWLFSFSLLLAGFTPFMGYAQSAEMKQKIEAFKNDQNEKYDMKYLNIADRNLGSIDKTYPEWKDEFLLKSKERKENNIGNKSYFKFYFSIYGYETPEDRQYALKDWMEEFVEGKSIRAGRDIRTYEYAKPTIILINKTEIIICTYDCSDYTPENFKNWKTQLLQYFGEDQTMVIEIMCDGPLEWTKNAPDPKDRKKLF